MNKHQHKILIVDDVAQNRNILQQMLQIAGYTTITADDGEQAITAFIEHSPDLILMDINMPVLDGRQATAKIKKISKDDYVPIIYVTALSAESSIEDAVTAGGDDYIAKPVNINILESKINAHLRIRGLYQELHKKKSILDLHNQALAREQDLITHFFDNTLKQGANVSSCVNFHISPQSIFNGDVLLTEQGKNGSLYILLGDFTGHGLAAAMGTMPVGQVFFTMARKAITISDIAYEINQHLLTFMPHGMFFAATLMEFSLNGKRLTVWAGGMPESFCIDHQGAIKNTIYSNHMPLGILPADEFNAITENYTLEEGDKIYLYSDGIVESENRDGVMFGYERLKNTLLNCRDQARLEYVINAQREFCTHVEQEDDITFVEIDCNKIPLLKQQQSSPVPAEADRLSWNLSIVLSEKEMRKQDPVSEITDMFNADYLVRHKGAVHTVLSELYSNALEHSILNMGSAQKKDEAQFLAYYKSREEKLLWLKDAMIKIDVKFDHDDKGFFLSLCLKDNGHGFKFKRMKQNRDGLSGRGLDIIFSLCEKVDYSSDGRSVEVIYRLQ